MRRTAVTLGVAALLALAGIGAATAAGAATPREDGIARGYYLALNGTAEDGSWSPQSDSIVDPRLGQCYDVQSLATGPAAWTESLNRTDAVALLSQKPCSDLTDGEADAGHAPRWTSPDAVSGDFTFRSVRFAHLP